MKRVWCFLCASTILLALAVGCTKAPKTATVLAEAGTKTIELSVPGMH